MLDEKSAIAYARVSTKGQDDPDDVSIPDQIETCTKYTEKNSLKLVIEPFKETMSGWKEYKRNVYYEMLEYIEKKKPHHLIFFYHDRLSRSPEDFEELIKLCKEIKHNLQIHDVYKKRSFGILDPEAYEELAQIRKDIIDAGLFSARLRFKVMRGMKKKRLERGYFPGYCPTGYKNNVILKTIEIDKERAPLIKKAFELMATGEYSLDDLAQEMRKRGLTTRVQRKNRREKMLPQPATRKKMHDILTNIFYTGKFMWSGKIYSNRGINNDQEPTYEPLISEMLFERVQDVLKKHRRNDRAVRKTEEWLYKGLLKCRHCGCDLVGEMHTKNKGKKNEKSYIYYRCTNGKKSADPDFYKRNFNQNTCPQKYWREEIITDAIERELDELKFDEDTFKWLREQIAEDVEERKEASEERLKQLETRLKQVKTERQNLFRNYQSGMIEEDDLDLYREEKARLKAELEEIENEIQELKAQEDKYLNEGIETLEFAHTFKSLYLAKYSAKKDLKKAQKDVEVRNRVKKLIMLRGMFRTIAMDKPLVKRHGKFERIESYPDMEIFWNEPFETLNLLKLEEDIKEYDKKIKGIPTPKSKNGTPGGI